MAPRANLQITATALGLVLSSGQASAQVNAWEAAWGAYMAIGAANGAITLYDRLSPRVQPQPAQQPQPAPQPQTATTGQNGGNRKNSSCVTHQPDYDQNGIFWGYKAVRTAC